MVRRPLRGGCVHRRATWTRNSRAACSRPWTSRSKNSFTGGLRGGYWPPFDVGPLNFGLGVDFSHFAPNLGQQSNVFCRTVCVNGVFDDLDLSVWVIGFDALLRAPLLKSATFPNGQLQPYLRVSPAIFVA